MANPTTTVIHADVGIAWDHLVGTTTTIVGRLTVRAQDDVRDLTGTTSGRTQDRAVRHLTDYYVLLNAMNTLDPNKANDLFLDVAEGHKAQAENALRKVGRSLDGIRVQFQKVNP